METEKLNYTKRTIDDMESDVSYMIRLQLSQGLNDGGMLSFRVPADPSRFTDLNVCMLKLEVSIETVDGATPPLASPACLDDQGMHAIFSSCDVRLNEKLVSTMQNYPYTAKLCRMLGMSQGLREGVFDTLDGTRKPSLKKSNLESDEDAAKRTILMNMARAQKRAILIGRIYSDVLMSCRQLLPPGVAIGIDLRRAPDEFSLMSCVAAASTYKLKITNASLYLRRMKLRPSLQTRAMESVKAGACLTFNRLETRLIGVPKESKVFRWLNCLNNAALPNRLYITFVSQKSLYGSVLKNSTYFEHNFVSRITVRLNGRDILVEPITSSFEVGDDGDLNLNKSQAMGGFYSLTEILDQVRDPTMPLRLGYNDYLMGNVVYALELGKCGEKSTTTGAIDIEAHFLRTENRQNAGTSEAMLMMLMTEKTEEVEASPQSI